ncbi:hypothetical protein Taro_056959, partial [Colocasia esculenta]|nr:hypothetical protein [Colocasia esculenta]
QVRPVDVNITGRLLNRLQTDVQISCFLESRQKPGTIRSAREGREHNGMAHVVEAGATNVGSKRSSTPKFQKCEYPKLKLFKTEGRGWGLLADEDIMAGQFVIEYCGEVISWKEAKRRSQVYEAKGRMDAYIISLNASESIDATKKGSLARCAAFVVQLPVLGFLELNLVVFR